MTRLSGSGDDQSSGPSDDPLSVALELADAVDGLANLWSVAAQGASLRLSPHQLRALRILESEPGLNLTTLAENMEIGPPTASRLCDRLEAAACWSVCCTRSGGVRCSSFSPGVAGMCWTRWTRAGRGRSPRFSRPWNPVSGRR